MKKALSDPGSDTICLSVCETADNGDFRPLFSHKDFAGLAAYVTGRKAAFPSSPL